MADDKKIVALCGPDGPLSLVIYTSTILVYFNWLNRAIRVDCVCPILWGPDAYSIPGIYVCPL
jgi:hypothetical protein